MIKYKNYLLSKLSKKKNIRKIIVFGSQANGTAKNDSDLDVMVVIDNNKLPFTKQYAQISTLLEPRLYAIDLIVKTYDEYKKRLLLDDPFVLAIDRTGQIVYER